MCFFKMLWRKTNFSSEILQVVINTYFGDFSLKQSERIKLNGKLWKSMRNLEEKEINILQEVFLVNNENTARENV